MYFTLCETVGGKEGICDGVAVGDMEGVEEGG